MTDVVVTVPKGQWLAWVAEGDLPGADWSRMTSHFWVRNLPAIDHGERVYVVAHGQLRGYAPLVLTEQYCEMNPYKSCLMRHGRAVAVTIDEPIVGFRGWRYRWWDRVEEVPFPNWQTEGVG